LNVCFVLSVKFHECTFRLKVNRLVAASFHTDGSHRLVI
jgi:hypothetical protein